MPKKTNNNKMDSDPVIVSYIEAKQGKIGVLTLNSEKTLNSLSLEMVTQLKHALTQWATDETVNAVLLKGAGKKAFCAGGDVQALYHSSISLKNGKAVDAEKFFLEEYQLDYLIHCYDKPIICLAHGVVMGGGLGLLSGASHRIVTDSTRMAMPEITIGLFPDVGGTYFLNDVPYNIGYFLALTGIPLNANDALFCNLAEYAITDAEATKLEIKLAKLSFTEDEESNQELISETLAGLASDQSTFKSSLIKQNLTALEDACRHNSLCKIVDAIEKFDSGNPFLEKAKLTMLSGSPLSLVLIYEQLKRYRYSDLQSTFKSELILATNIVRNSDFSEGVRALLIDKDKSPKWKYEHFSDVPSSVIDKAFMAPWKKNPLENCFD